MEGLYSKIEDTMKQVITIEARRQAYSIDQIRNTMTVGDLLEALSYFDEDMPIYFSHDNGYTFGSLTTEDINEMATGEEEEDGEE